MMIVTVDVPMMGDRYEFQFDENTYVAVLIEEFIDMICRKNSPIMMAWIGIPYFFMAIPRKQPMVG